QPTVVGEPAVVDLAVPVQDQFQVTGREPDRVSLAVGDRRGYRIAPQPRLQLRPGRAGEKTVVEEPPPGGFELRVAGAADLPEGGADDLVRRGRLEPDAPGGHFEGRAT